MSSSPLQDLVAFAVADTTLIKEMVTESDAFLAAKASRKPDPGFTKDEANQLRAVGESILSAVEPEEGSGAKKSTVQVSPRVSDYILQLVGPIKQRGFLAEMTLVYLIARVEAFIKDYLIELLVLKPEAMRSSATLTYEEALAFDSIASMHRALAEKEAERLGYGSIDAISREIEKKFKVSLQTFSHWDRLLEAGHRRNLVVHNKGQINAVYRKKMGAPQVAHLEGVDSQYVDGVAQVIIDFFEFFHQRLSSKGKASAT